MARSTKIVTPARAPKATSIALVRAFPEERPAARGATPADAAAAPVSASARVRDGLVLRLVGQKKKSTAKSVPHEPRAR